MSSQQLIWSNDPALVLKEAMKKGTILKGVVYKREVKEVKLREGGDMTSKEVELLTIDLGGINGICSAEEFAAHSFKTLKGFLGHTIDVCVINVIEDEKGQPLAILSRKAAEAKKGESLKETIKEEDIVDGVISGYNEQKNTIFINIGGLDAFCYLEDWDYVRIPNVRDVGVIGEPVTVVVKKITQDPFIIRVSRKDASKDPWEGIEQDFPVDSDVIGVVSNVTERFGTFVNIKKGVTILANVPRSYNLPDPVPGIVVRGKIVRMSEKDRKGLMVITNYPHGAPKHGNPGAYLFG